MVQLGPVLGAARVTRGGLCFCQPLLSIALLGSLRRPLSTCASISMSQASPSPRWVQDVAAAAARNKEPFDKYVQLGTVTAEGKPAVRTVVFRGFLQSRTSADDSIYKGSKETLTFITDTRSNKMKESRHAEVCWYLSGTREQFRLSGQLEVRPYMTQSYFIFSVRHETCAWYEDNDSLTCFFFAQMITQDSPPQLNK